MYFGGQQVQTSFVGEVWLVFLFFLFIFIFFYIFSTIHFFQPFFPINFFVLQEDRGLRFPLPPNLSFIHHIRATLLWLAFCISKPLSSPFSYCHSAAALGCNVLPHSLWTAMTTCWRSLTKPEGLLSQEGSARLCRWLHCFIYFHEGKQKARLNRG